MVSFSRKAHRFWDLMRWGLTLREGEASGEAAFVGPVGGCDAHGLRPLLVVHSHRRSGTHFLIDTLRSRFDVASDWFHLEEDFFSRLTHLPVVIKSHERVWGEKIRSDVHWESYLHWVAASALYTNAVHMHIVRDPRKVMRSQYYFDLKGHEPAYRIDPQTSFTDYLRAPSPRDPQGQHTHLSYWCAQVESWSAQPGVFQIRYEDLLATPDRELDRIAQFLRMPLHREKWRTSTAIGRHTSDRQARTVAAHWGSQEEDLLQETARRFRLPDLGYGLSAAAESDVPETGVPTLRPARA